MKRTIRGSVVAAAIALLAFSGSSPSSAASKVAVDLPNTSVAGGEVVPLPIFLTGFDFAELTVTLVTDSGTLSVADGPSLQLNPGYPSLTNQAEISFHGAAADVVAVMETGVTWTAPGDASTSTDLALRVQVGEFEEGTTYDPATGHTYKYVSDELTWGAARDAAKLLTFKGKVGYLANITTESENTFVANKSGAEDVWFGGTADLVFINQAMDAAGKPNVAGPTQNAGKYYWGDGPEKGENFTNGLVNPVAVGSSFNGWAPNEPNDAGGNEGCAVTNWEGAAGKWNDLDCTWTNSYIVEFDTTPQQFELAVVTFDNITGEDKDAFPAEVEDEVVEEELADTGYNPWLILALAVLLVAVGSSVRLLSSKR